MPLLFTSQSAALGEGRVAKIVSESSGGGWVGGGGREVCCTRHRGKAQTAEPRSAASHLLNWGMIGLWLECDWGMVGVWLGYDQVMIGV